MGKYRVAACAFLGLCFLSPGLFSQEAAETIPEALRRPERGEAPRYPRDMVIGDLGQGEAPGEAYRFARDVLDALAAGSRTAPVLAESLSVLTENVFEEILSLEPRTYHLGGGKTEADGSVSFLVRFLGAAESLTGELYLRWEEYAESAKSETPVDGETPANSGAVPEIPPEPAAADESKEENSAAPAIPPSPPPLAEIADSGESSGSSGGRWLLDGLALEEKKPLTDVRDSYRYDFSPYERFY